MSLGLPRPSPPVVATFLAGQETTDGSTAIHPHPQDPPMSVNPPAANHAHHTSYPEEGHHLDCFYINFSTGRLSVKISLPEGGLVSFNGLLVGKVFIHEGQEYVALNSEFFLSRGSHALGPVCRLLRGDKIVYSKTKAVIDIEFCIERQPRSSEM